MRKVGLFYIPLLILLIYCTSTGYALDPTFMRNGEVYLSITGAPASSGIIDGVYRLNDPEGALGGNYPVHLFQEPKIQNFAVDINREVFTISAPNESKIDENFMLKRQVLDATIGLRPSSYETGANRASTFPTNRVVTERPAKFGHTITNDQADWGAHRYIHHDNRTTYGGDGAGTNIYRTNTNPGASGQNLRDVKGCKIWARDPWNTFKALQGKKTTPPDNPLEYLPVYTNQALVLPYYPDKDWYEIPNGAWFNSWRCKFGDGGDARSLTNHRTYGDKYASPFPNYGRFYYQSFRDYAEGTQYDWRLVRHKATDRRLENYGSGRYPQPPFATTYEMSISRGVIAACLDGCGGSRATPGSTEANEMIFYPAFMPYSDSRGNPAVTVYSYSRTVGKGDFNLKRDSGTRSYKHVTFGDGAGIGANDTRWIGVSKGETEAGGREVDYVYYLGTSQIQKWVPGMRNLNISAVSVSNQWDEKGGIIFAFDRTSNQIIKFTLNPSDSNTPGLLDNYTTIDVSELMSRIGANSTIDDIAADGFGNLYVSLTYPSSNSRYNAPKALKYNFDDAISMKAPNRDTGAGDASQVVYQFRYQVDYRKSVWKVSAVGQPLEEVGAAKVARIFYTKDVHVKKENMGLMPTAAEVRSNKSIDGQVRAAMSHEEEYEPESTSTVSISGKSKLAIINAPTPPEVLSLGEGKSYLDIIGAYSDYPTPDARNFTTAQDRVARHNPKSLKLSTPYFFMVENYPLHESIQDPNVHPDHDGDGKRSGFISSIISGNPNLKYIRYYWNLWMVKDHNGKPVLPPNPSGTGNDATNEYTFFYSPIPASYILTCKVSYDWYDYNTVKFGQTINQWKSDPTIRHQKTDWALPTAVGLTPNGTPNVNTDPTGTLNQMLSEIFSNYTPVDDGDPSKATAIATIRNKILEDPQASFMAFESITATGTIPIEKEASEKARVQRCNPNGNITLAANWNPRTGSIMQPSEGYHGIDSNFEYYWRVDTASQSIFYNGQDKPDPASGKMHTYIVGSDYEYISKKLMDSTDEVYYVNAKKDFQFLKDGADLRWQIKEAELEAVLEYPTLDANGKLATNTLPLTGVSVKDGIEGGRNFKYIELPANSLPPTDPFIGKLRIKISRMFEYGMFIFDDKGNQLQRYPIWLPKRLTISGNADVMVMDSEKPVLVFSQTTPNQLYGETGETLLNAGNSQSANNIEFTITDNNPWESLAALEHHAHYKRTNISYNKTRLGRIYSENSSFNLKPVFNNENRFVKIYYQMPNTNADGQVTNAYIPSWGGGNKDSISLEETELLEDDRAYNMLYTKLKFKLPFDKLNYNESSKKHTALTIPTNYANNTPGYEPLGFKISYSDSSGNETLMTDFNVVLHIKDTILPLPFGEIRESKNLSYAYIPAGKSDMSTDVDKKLDSNWYSSLRKEARTPGLKFDANPNWVADKSTGEIGKFGNKTFYALPFLNGGNRIISLKTQGFMSNINVKRLVPGNIQVEDNVEVFIKAGATDNAGAAMAKLSYSYYNINGEEVTRTANYPNSWNGNGVSYSSDAATTQVARLIFRESRPQILDTGEEVEGHGFPLGIPIIIEAKDNARDWDSYPNASHKDGSFSWGTLLKGRERSNTRTFSTTLPVFGTTFDIRTIDKYERK